jgi:hypothetical protein
MHKEYALDPATITNWENIRFISSLFGWSKGRIMSAMPTIRKWQRMVWNGVSTCKPVEKKRIEQMLLCMTAQVVRRQQAEYNGNVPWLENAISEHENKAFAAIISGESKLDHVDVLPFEDLDDNHTLMSRHPGVVRREAEEITNHLQLLLRTSSHIILVDPYFNPNESRFIEVMRHMLNMIADSTYKRATPILVELHTSINEGRKKGNWDYWLNEKRNGSQAVLSQITPKDLCLTVIIWKEFDDGEKLHNRYVLTELGGVCFGTGLDQQENGTGQTDDLIRMLEEQRQYRWNQYAGPDPAFEEMGRFTVCSREPIWG